MTASSLGDDLVRARHALLEAERTADPDERFLAAHLVALRVAAVVLAQWSAPGGARRPRNAWRTVAEAVPPLAGWAHHYASSESQRDAVRAGAVGVVGVREADALVADTRRFLGLVDATVAAGAQHAVLTAAGAPA